MKKRMTAAAVLCVAAGAAAADPARIAVDASKTGAEIAPSLYGIFYEEINHAGDGGLYAELIRNRSFEETLPIEGCTLTNGVCVAPDLPHYQGPGAKKRRPEGRPWSQEWKFESPWPAWSIETSGGAQAELSLGEEGPVHPRNVRYLRIRTAALPSGGGVRLLNEGYWGIGAKQGETYDGSFFARVTAGAGGAVRVGLIGDDGRDLGSAAVKGVTNAAWTKYTCHFPCLGTDPKARFVLQAPSAGTLDLDVVSLFPRHTFKNRPNGCRADLGQLLADLKPAFVRFPGGCVVEGATFANRYRWKETIGPIEGRPGHWSLWNYRNVDGLGFHEFLQLCEDLGADGMFVCNVGLSCEFRNGDFLPEDRLHEQLQDTLDAVEYALGAPDTKWGAERAKNGHPAPFPLKYVEIGNENHGPVYNRYYRIFHAALKKAWPQLTLIFNGGTSDTAPAPEAGPVEMFDEHYYRDPDWFLDNAGRYDAVPRDRGYVLYLGEYACNRGVGSGNLLAGLSEAVFMAGLERNGDLVKLCSYAPLFFNVNDIKWPVNLIGFDSSVAFGRSSYHVQKLFSQHRPDVNLATECELHGAPGEAPYAGRIGLGAWETAVEYKDLRLTVGAGPETRLNPDGAGGWKAAEGRWKVAQGTVGTDDQGAWRRGLFAGPAPKDGYALKLKARKTGGDEGFLVLFGAADERNYCLLNLGGWGNKSHGFERVADLKQQPIGARVPGSIEAGRWYDIEIRVAGSRLEAFLDGRRVLQAGATSSRFAAIAGLDRRAGEIVVKAVNATDRPVRAQVEVSGAKLQPSGRRIELSGDLKAENTVAQPRLVVPIESALEGVGASFPVELKPASLTILRLPLVK